MKRSWILTAALLAIPVAAHAQSPDWRAWNDGMRVAASSGRPVIVDVYTDWCGWCKRMDHDVYARADVSDYLRRRFVTIRLNAEGPGAGNYQGRRYSAEELAEHFRVSGYPTTIFLRANGDHMANVPGYLPPDRFLVMLRYVAEGYADRNVPFSEFERQANGERGAR